MSDVPELRQELDRKVMETIERIAHDRNTGKSTRAQYGYGVSILWNAVAGLVDKDFVSIIGQMQPEVDESFDTRRYFRNARGDNAVVGNNHRGVASFTLYKHDSKSPVSVKEYNFTEDSCAIKRAQQEVDSLCSKLVAGGFIEF